ncbi:MAG: hypothetical protein JKY50_18895 [Oleispira sp.]|nr:hypothetical protein [Oleispira sp.]
MKNYEKHLLSLKPNELPEPKACIPYSSLTALVSIARADVYQKEIVQLACSLPYGTSSWPKFGSYIDDWYRVEVDGHKKQLLTCERGSCRVIENCENMIDLTYHILDVVMPSHTDSAEILKKKLDHIKDQRLRIWLSKSSKTYQMFQVNKYFGIRKLNSSVTWMCEELVRMGVFKNVDEAFLSEKHIVKGLMLSGLSKPTAEKLYGDLRSA